MMKNTAQNLDEFQAQARGFVTKARSAGASNTAIANTIKLMYGMYEADQARKITPYQQSQIDLRKEELGLKREELGLNAEGRKIGELDTGDGISGTPRILGDSVSTATPGMDQQSAPTALEQLGNLSEKAIGGASIPQKIGGKEYFLTPEQHEMYQGFGAKGLDIGKPLASGFGWAPSINRSPENKQIFSSGFSSNEPSAKMPSWIKKILDGQSKNGAG